MLLVVPLATIASGWSWRSWSRSAGAAGRRSAAPLTGSSTSSRSCSRCAIIARALAVRVHTPTAGCSTACSAASGLDGLARTWLGDPDLALWAVMAVLIWSSVGFYMVLFSAAMELDPDRAHRGRDARRRRPAGHPVRRITLPLICATASRSRSSTSASLALDGFALVQIMTVGRAAPTTPPR